METQYNGTEVLRAGEKIGGCKEDFLAFYPLSYNQRDLWLIYQMAPESVAYNIYSTVQITSALDVEVWQQTWQKIVDRHAILRTTYTNRDNRPIQVIHPHHKVKLEVTDTSTWSEKELKEQILRQVRQPFDLKNGPVLRIYLFKRSVQDYIQLLTMHEIAGEMRSINILLSELQRLYAVEVGILNSKSSRG
ncbi:hypothetical protein B4U84_25840 [Westiellopsis prolifica IICB1]|nr:hypothetical protein B4U84_25840 [Westiellopsis prolifica IICB1]